MSTNSTSGITRFIEEVMPGLIVIMLLCLLSLHGLLVWRKLHDKKEENSVAAQELRPSMKGCIDRGERVEKIAMSFDAQDGATAFLIERVCEGRIELFDSATGHKKGEVEFINGAVLVSQGTTRIGIR